MSSNPIDRVKFALSHVENNSVRILAREQWEKLVLANGEPTLLLSTAELDMNMQNACVVAVAASGVQNLNPGADVVRFDRNDYPYIYNTDHYSVVEHLSSHPKYNQIVGNGRSRWVNRSDRHWTKMFLLSARKK
jgi:hypothetical protein